MDYRIYRTLAYHHWLGDKHHAVSYRGEILLFHIHAIIRLSYSKLFSSLAWRAGVLLSTLKPV